MSDETVTDALADLDRFINYEADDCSRAGLASLRSIRTRIAALVEAARVFDVYDVNARFNYVVDGHKGVSVAEYRALSEALRGVGR